MYSPRLYEPPTQTAGAFFSRPANLRPQHLAPATQAFQVASRTGVRRPLLPCSPAATCPGLSRTSVFVRERTRRERAGQRTERVRVRSVPLFPSGRPRARLPRPDRDSRIGGSAEWGKSQTVGWGKASSILNNVLVLIADLLSVGLLPAETRRRESQMSGPRTAQRHARQRNVTAWARVHGSCRRRREYFETATISLSRFDSASRAHGRSRWAESVGGVGGRSR
jgi:hypothetical protein